jgi:hypothetical protein
MPGALLFLICNGGLLVVNIISKIMLMKNVYIVSIILLGGMALSVSAQTATQPKPIGGDKDAHGCLVSAGYSWNAAQKACTRPWEDAAKLKATTSATKVKTPTSSTTARLQAAQKQMATTVNQLNAALTRVQTLWSRTSSRLDKLTLQKINVTTPRKYLADSKLKLDEARAKIAIVKAAGDAALSINQTAKGTAAMRSVEAMVKDATKTITAAETLISKSISSIKPGVNKTTTSPASANKR